MCVIGRPPHQQHQTRRWAERRQSRIKKKCLFSHFQHEKNVFFFSRGRKAGRAQPGHGAGGCQQEHAALQGQRGRNPATPQKTLPAQFPSFFKLLAHPRVQRLMQEDSGGLLVRRQQGRGLKVSSRVLLPPPWTTPAWSLALKPFHFKPYFWGKTKQNKKKASALQAAFPVVLGVAFSLAG